MIRLEAGMPTSRFTRLIGVPERSYRRWQQRARQGASGEGAVADALGGSARADRDRLRRSLSAVGSGTIATLMRIDGYDAPDSTVYRALKRAGRVLEVDYRAERRQHAEARRAAFVVPLSGPNQVWQCDFTEYTTRMGGTWRIGGVADYWSKLELGYHVATTANHRDAIETVELALAESERLLGRPLLDAVTDRDSGEVRPVTLVTDNGPCFKSARFAAFIDRHPELIHIRTRRKSPGQNGVRERAFGSLKYEHLYRHEIDDGHDLGLHVERYRQLFNTIRPHQALAGRRPLHVHLETINDPQTIKSNQPETLPLS